MFDFSDETNTVQEKKVLVMDYLEKRTSGNETIMNEVLKILFKIGREK